MSLQKVTTGLGPYEGASLQKTQKRQAAASKGKEISKEKDTISLSSEAKLLAAGLQEAQKAPDIRREKVDALKQQIAANNYMPDTRAIATKIVDEQMELWK